jgi:adenylate cyclase
VNVRRLAAILCADVVGSSRLMEADESGTLDAISGVLSEVIAPAAARHHGRLVKTTGDGAILEFKSPVEAVACGVEIQRGALERAIPLPEHRRILLRIGINLGDIVVGDDGELYGDGVNVAVHLEQAANAGGLCISGKVFDELQGKLSLMFEDRGEQHLKSITRPVRVYSLAGGHTIDPAPKTLPLPDKPSIAVLPFANLSGDAEQDYLADGIVEEILTALARLKWLFVSARNSTFSYKGRAIDAKSVGAELGVRYLLSGSVRKSGNRLRITGRLVEAETGTQIWADRYEGALEDVFDLQDQITASVAGAIEPRIRHAEIERARLKPPENLNSYDRFLRALSHFYEGSKEGVGKAMAVVETIVEADPDYAQPYGLGAWCYVYHIAQGWSENPAADAARGMQYARTAIERERNDPTILWMAGGAFGFLARDQDTALILLERALALNPNSASAYWMYGWVLCWAGRQREAIPHLQCAIRLSPVDRTMVAAESGLALALCMDGQYEDSILWAHKAIAEQASWTASYRSLAASLAQLGRLGEAKRAVEQLLSLEPDYRISKYAPLYRPSEGTERYLEGLRKAGLPE